MDISSSVKCDILNRGDQVAASLRKEHSPEEQVAVNRRDVRVGVASAHDDRM
jgi:hypothetical protein